MMLANGVFQGLWSVVSNKGVRASTTLSVDGSWEAVSDTISIAGCNALSAMVHNVDTCRSSKKIQIMENYYEEAVMLY